MDTTVYIDGFNLYYRLLKSRPALKWVNPVALAKRLLPKNAVTGPLFYGSRFGAARSRRPAPAATLFRRAYTLPELKIHFGTFLEVKKYAGLVKPILDSAAAENRKPFLPWPDVAYVWKTEEKGSDVHIATYLLLDAFQNRYQVAAVLSNDSDLIEPIDVTCRILGKPVGLLSPVKNPQPALRQAAAFLKHVTPADVAACQFPNPVTLATGTQVHKDPSWV
jgi:hypothetical protein